MLPSASASDKKPSRRLRRGLLFLLLGLALCTAGQTDAAPTEMDLAIAPYRYSILAWEVEHLSSKWLRKLGNAWPGEPQLTPQEQKLLVQEFFNLGRQQREISGGLRRARLAQSEAGGQGSEAFAAADYLAASLAQNRQRQAELLPRVEAIVETELSRILEAEGLTTGWAGVFPPVDVVFGSPPAVLIRSPRDRIYRQGAVLLEPGLSDAVKEELETLALTTENRSAVVEPTGGLSVYPSVVSDTNGLRYALETAAHEWVHHWLFFRPLGRNYQHSPETLALNETAATIAGEELGGQVYRALTGEAVSRPPAMEAPAGFDFNAEMRRTRLAAEEKLAQGDIAGAEAGMEESRLRFVRHGYNIRKINQAYFAFYGSYATRPGSVSPIGGQLRELRRSSPSLRAFLEEVARFGSYAEFAEHRELR